MIKIAILDDQNIFRQSLGLLVNSITEFRLVLAEASGQDLLDTFKSTSDLPHVLLMDMNMPGMNGLDLIEILQREYPEVKILVLSVHGQDRLISKMISAGASSYLIKNCDKAELIAAIISIYETGYYINKQILSALQKSDKTKKPNGANLAAFNTDLTTREKEVLLYICKEYNSAEIASRLFISVRTVEGHRNTLMLKTQSRNTAGLVLYAIRHELIDVI